jgi:hypothetical protein
VYFLCIEGFFFGILIHTMANKVHEKKPYSLTLIKSPSDWEIDTILNQYFVCETSLSSKYLPRRLRDFVHDVFTLLCDRDELHESLSQSTQSPVNKEVLLNIATMLAGSTNDRIQVRYRKIVGRVLGSVRLHRAEMKVNLNQRQPVVVDSDRPQWPTDINDITDIFQSLARRSLCRDISAFLCHILGTTVSGEWKLCFVGVVTNKSSGEFEKPLDVEVEDGQVARVQQHLDLISSELDRSCLGFLPNSLVCVKALKTRGTTSLTEEAFYTSDGIWKEGTLGCVLLYNQKKFGVTCHHVHTAKLLSEYDALTVAVEPYALKCPEMDCSFFEMKPILGEICPAEEAEGKATREAISTHPSDSHVQIYNLLPLKFLTTEAVGCCLGEDVFKMGKQTGLTVGKLKSMSVFFRDPHTGESYAEAVEVGWVDEGCRFASHGDCGSLYCVRRDGMFVPIGIHRASGATSSYGSNFWSALDVLPESDSDIFFVNPPAFAL